MPADLLEFLLLTFHSLEFRTGLQSGPVDRGIGELGLRNSNACGQMDTAADEDNDNPTHPHISSAALDLKQGGKGWIN